MVTDMARFMLYISVRTDKSLTPALSHMDFKGGCSCLDSLIAGITIE